MAIDDASKCPFERDPEQTREPVNLGNVEASQSDKAGDTGMIRRKQSLSKDYGAARPRLRSATRFRETFLKTATNDFSEAFLKHSKAESESNREKRRIPRPRSAAPRAETRCEKEAGASATALVGP